MRLRVRVCVGRGVSGGRGARGGTSSRMRVAEGQGACACVRGVAEGRVGREWVCEDGRGEERGWSAGGVRRGEVAPVADAC